jgi:hypothetical protein
MPLKSLRNLRFLVIASATCLAANAQFTQQQIDGYRHAVVRVDAAMCAGVPGGRLVGSGFLWKQDTSVVTALHVVNGCKEISVYSDMARNSADAHVSKVVVKEDLVLLTLDKGISGTTNFVVSKDAPADTEDLILVGFPGDSSGSTGKTIRRQFSGDTLEKVVSYADQQELKSNPSPALDIKVVFLQGTFEHGHSGGPILNHDGAVIGIADGGLKHGTTEDSWAIPSADIADLESSTEPLGGMAIQRSSLLFSATPIANIGPTIHCGGGDFKHLKSVGYSDVLATADDPAGLQRLASLSQIPATTLTFEVYQDTQTRATIVLPEGEQLMQEGQICSAISTGGGVRTIAIVADSSADPTGKAAAAAFETSVGIFPGNGWNFGQAFSYLSPLPVLGGGMAWRKDWVHYLPPGPPLGVLFDAQQFETLALRNNLLLGVTAINTRWTPAVVQTQQACLANSAVSLYCTQALQDYRDWIESVLSVHLSTLAGT